MHEFWADNRFVDDCPPKRGSIAGRDGACLHDDIPPVRSRGRRPRGLSAESEMPIIPARELRSWRSFQLHQCCILSFYCANFQQICSLYRGEPPESAQMVFAYWTAKKKKLSENGSTRTMARLTCVALMCAMAKSFWSRPNLSTEN